LGCSNYPECKFTRQLSTNGDDQDDNAPVGDTNMGDDPATGLPIYLRRGPYGPYVQLGDPETKKPKRASLPKGQSAGDLDLARAIALLALPRDVGAHPETGDMIQAGLGRFGPYLKYQGSFSSLPAEDDLLTIGINRAVDLLVEAAKKKGRLLGQHPSGGDVHVKAGRYGPYVEHNKLRATLPKGDEISEMTLDAALVLLAEKAAKAPPPKKAAKKAPKKAAKKASAKKAAPKKAVGKKAAAKKTTAKKAS
jgi:DNA topoisomerase-1